MDLKILKERVVFTLIIFAFFNIFLNTVSFSKDSIENLTSGDTFKNVEDKIPKKSNDNRKSSVPDIVHRHTVGLGIGQTTLNSDFDEYGDDSITWDAFYSYAASYSFSFLANFHSFKHEFAKKKTSVSLSAATFGVKGSLYHIDSFSPVVVGGLGFYRPIVTTSVNGTVVESKNKITFGAHLGAGVDLILNSHYTIGMLGVYHDPFDVKQDAGADLEGSYFKLLITGFYTF